MSQETAKLIIKAERNIQEAENLLYSFVLNGKLSQEDYETACDHSVSLVTYLKEVKKKLIKQPEMNKYKFMFNYSLTNI